MATALELQSKFLTKNGVLVIGLGMALCATAVFMVRRG